ncbi:MAG: ABC transporter ATP-binding protein [Ferrimicrobium sp.]
MNSAIEVENLQITYGSLHAVQGLSFRVPFGSILGLLGPNGAGKTSTMEAMEGYRRPAAGTIRVLDLEPYRFQRQLASSVGVMLQEGGIPPRMTPKQALALYEKFYDSPRSSEELSQRLDLVSVLRTPYRRLSGGEKQRFLLALALIGRPRVLFLDEPTAGVDPVGKMAIRELLTELRAEGLAIVLTSHELEQIDQIVDDVLIIDHGLARASGTPEELRTRFGTEAVDFVCSSEIDVAQVVALLKSPVEALGRCRYRVWAAPTPELIRQLADTLDAIGVDAESIATVSPSLEAVYLSLIGEGKL